MQALTGNISTKYLQNGDVLTQSILDKTRWHAVHRSAIIIPVPTWTRELVGMRFLCTTTRCRSVAVEMQLHPILQTADRMFP